MIDCHVDRKRSCSKAIANKGRVPHAFLGKERLGPRLLLDLGAGQGSGRQFPNSPTSTSSGAPNLLRRYDRRSAIIGRIDNTVQEHVTKRALPRPIIRSNRRQLWKTLGRTLTTWYGIKMMRNGKRYSQSCDRDQPSALWRH